MCCQDTEVLDLPPAAIEMLAHYRRLQAERGWDWGDDRVEMFRWMRFSKLGDLFGAVAETGDWAAAVREVVGGTPPAGIVVVRLVPAGAGGTAVAGVVRTGPARPVPAGRTTQVDVVVESALDRDVMIEVVPAAGPPDAESPGRSADVPAAAEVPDGAATATDVDARPSRLRAGATTVRTVEVAGPFALRIHAEAGTEAVAGADVARAGGVDVPIEGAAVTVPAATLRLRSSRCARWSVTDPSGGAWFPDGVLHKWDVHDRPFFHADEVTLVVPAGPVAVTCARGLEHGRVQRTVTAGAGAEVLVACDPPRLVDPAADGWYGGDLHVHMNYSGDLVCTPADVARMQAGEGLHLVNLTAGNLQTSLVYDRELLESTVGEDLWASPEAVARMGVEYRNDLLGHVHGLGPDAAPTRYHAGFERSDTPEDWPPNLDACEQLHAAGATVGYPHPVAAAFPPDGDPAAFLAEPRSVEARELVIDAALGAVDGVDLISPFDDEGAIFLYHRLLSAGLRLAATAGTDVFLSFSHGPGVASNPLGWGRVYARLDGPLGVDAFKDAVRARRTVVTNGPWLTFTVDGQGPGAVLDRAAGSVVRARATVIGGAPIDTLDVVGPGGVVARIDAGGEAGAELVADVPVDEPTWLAAVARGPGGDAVLDARALAHTSPVHVDVDGRPVADPEAARWCLALIDGVEALVQGHGRFHDHTRAGRLAAYAELADRARAVYRGVLDPPPAA